MYKNLRVLGLLSAFPMLSMFGAHGAVITQYGTDVNFTYDNATIFGQGFVVDNSLNFSPVDFNAQSANTEGFTLVDGTLNIEVAANLGSGKAVDSVELIESGSYFLNGDDSGVTASGWLQLTSMTLTCDGLFACTDTDIFNAVPLTTVGALGAWDASGAVDLFSIAGWGQDTQVLAQIQNVLTANSFINGDTAFIQKLSSGLGVNVIDAPQVPLPASAWLLGTALTGLFAAKRRS